MQELFPDDVLNSVLHVFPGVDNVHWQRFRNAQELKLALKDERNYGAFTRHFINALNSRPFLNFLEELTGISGLIPIPTWKAEGCIRL